MTKTFKIDFVSDVVCPWCAIGLAGLDAALERIGDEAKADITFHPFELNPDMPVGGKRWLDHIVGKYAMPIDQARANQARIRSRAAEAGFAMNTSDSTRTYNSFNAHRLLEWAKDQGKQVELKRALLSAYFTDQADISDHDLLAATAEKVGLDGKGAHEILASDRFAEQVRQEIALWQQRGITGVPAVIINDRYLISGGQPAEAFEQQLRAIASEMTAA